MPVGSSYSVNGDCGIWALPPSTLPSGVDGKVNDIIPSSASFFGSNVDHSSKPILTAHSLDMDAVSGLNNHPHHSCSEGIDTVSMIISNNHSITGKIHGIHEFDSHSSLDEFSSSGQSSVSNRTPSPSNEAFSDGYASSNFPVISTHPCPSCKCLIDVSETSFHSHISMCSKRSTQFVHPANSMSNSKDCIKTLRSTIQHLDTTQCLNIMQILQRLTDSTHLNQSASASARSTPTSTCPLVRAAEESVISLLFGSSTTLTDESFCPSVAFAPHVPIGPAVNERGFPQPIALHPHPLRTSPFDEPNQTIVELPLMDTEHELHATDGMNTPKRAISPSSPAFLSTLHPSTLPDINDYVSTINLRTDINSVQKQPINDQNCHQTQSYIYNYNDKKDVDVDIVSIFSKFPRPVNKFHGNALPTVTPPQSPHLINLRNLDTPPIPSARAMYAKSSAVHALKLSNSPPSKMTSLFPSSSSSTILSSSARKMAPVMDNNLVPFTYMSETADMYTYDIVDNIDIDSCSAGSKRKRGSTIFDFVQEVDIKMQRI